MTNVLLVIGALLLIKATTVFVDASSHEVNVYGEPQLIRCTVYTADEGAITASGSVVREGIVAGKKEWLGKGCIIYENNNGRVGRLIGIYEFKDTGDGINGSLKKGTSIDVYRDNLDRCQEWIDTYGDYVFIQIIDGRG